MKIHILLIDDDKDELLIFNEAIKQLALFECNLTYAATAEQAVEMLTHIHPHFIFIDFNMPGQTGLDFLKQTKGHPAVKSAATYLVSTFVNAETTQQALQCGVKGCLTKTTSIASLSRLIKNVFESNSTFISTITTSAV